VNEAAKTSNRRHVFRIVAGAGAAVSLLGTALAWARSLVPNVLYEPPVRRRVGLPKRFPEGHTYLSDEKVFLIRKEGKIRALSAICTHLGCTVGTQGEGYHCPCHGSTFSADGGNTGGPAPRPLPWHPVELGGGGVLIVDLGTEVGPEQELVLEAPPASGTGEPKDGKPVKGGPR
jgi:cytochrome b6-f complex iron-sulfur subunit